MLIQIFSFTILFFIIMDALGNLPIFISLLKNVPSTQKKKIIIRELFFSLIIMCIFLFLGQNILQILHLKIYTISIVGSIILFFIAIKMIYPDILNDKKINNFQEVPFLIPLAVPLITGPSLLATILVLSKKYSSQILYIFISLILAWLMTFIVLLSADFFSKILGKKGINILEKIMGIILILLSTQMFLDGINSWLK